MTLWPPERCIPSRRGETNPSNPNIRKTTPSTLQIVLAINPPLIPGPFIREQLSRSGLKEMAACSLSALPMTATAQAAFSTHDGKELTPPQFLRMHRCIRSVPEPDQNRK